MKVKVEFSEEDRELLRCVVVLRKALSDIYEEFKRNEDCPTLIGAIAKAALDGKLG